MKSYTYHLLELGEIRLFKIEDERDGLSGGVPCKVQRGDTTTTLPVRVTIIRTALRDAPQYDALSYVWGSPIRSCHLVLADGTTMPITESIAEAAPFLLNTRRTGYLWIDQVCIDQGDVEEVNHQVAIMGTIYSKALSVLVWLGCGFDGADRANEVFRAYEDAAIRLGDQKADEQLRSCLAGSPGAMMNRAAIIKLMKLPWFQRAWVVQEFALAKDVDILLGDFRWRPDLVFVVTCQLRDYGREPGTGYSDAEMAYLRNNHPFQIIWNIKSSHHEALYSLLSRMAGRSEATDEHDLVYAFLSLNKDQRIRLQPDYRLPVREVFITTAKQIMLGSRNLDLLSTLPREVAQSKDSPLAPLNLPSWVPDWRCKTSTLPMYYRHGRNRFAASGGSEYTIAEDAPKMLLDRLLIRGWRIGVVSKVSFSSGTGSRKSMTSFIKLDEQLAEIRRLVDELASSKPSASSRKREISRISVLRICIADGAFVPHLSEPTVERDTEFRPLGKLSDLNLEALMRAYDPEDDFGTWETERWLLREYALVLRNRRVFVTDDLSVGLGPRAAREGDIVAVVSGSATPLMIRPVAGAQPDSSLYTFVGQCYLEGAMYGEKGGVGALDLENYILV